MFQHSALSFEHSALRKYRELHTLIRQLAKHEAADGPFLVAGRYNKQENDNMYLMCILTSHQCSRYSTCSTVSFRSIVLGFNQDHLIQSAESSSKASLLESFPLLFS